MFLVQFCVSQVHSVAFTSWATQGRGVLLSQGVLSSSNSWSGRHDVQLLLTSPGIGYLLMIYGEYDRYIIGTGNDKSAL